MFRLVPYRQRNREDFFLPQAFHNLLNWPETVWRGFNVDVKETEEGYVLQADLPGVAKNDIKLGVEDGYLTIAVNQQENRSEEKDNYICRERRQMSSQRSFYVGNIKPEDIVANHQDGVLEIKFPKATEESKSRQIPIS